MNLMKQPELDAVLRSIGDTTPLSGQIIPWNWMSTDFFSVLPGRHRHQPDLRNVTGYCQPFKRPIELEEEVKYWPYFVAQYVDNENQSIENCSIEYGLYLEGETDHYYIDLTGWHISRHKQERTHHAGVKTGMTDYASQVVFAHYPWIRHLLETFCEQMALRERCAGIPYLASLANHHLVSVYRDGGVDRSSIIAELSFNRPLKHLIWGK